MANRCIFKMDHAQIELAVLRLRPDWVLADLTICEFLEGGYSNDNYRISYKGEEFALRLPQRTQPYVDRFREKEWYARLPETVGIRPTVLDAASGCMLSPWVEGTLLVDCWDSFCSDDLIDYLVDLHTALPDPGRNYVIQDLLDSYSSGSYSAADVPIEHRQSCHNDLNPWNIIINETGWLTLDWEFAGKNDPIFDLVSLHQGLGCAEDQLYDLAYAYVTAMNLHVQNLQQRTAEQLKNYWLREYAWARYQLTIGNSRQEIIDQAESALSHL